jgi:N-acetylglucosaminyldiphosphoundecaprenol N-acetyl-beta-D-mannosaminyltransferase
VNIDILGIGVDAQRFEQAIETLATWATQSEGRRYVCTCPVYTLMRARELLPLKQALKDADMVVADGMPVAWVQRWWGATEAERVYGPDVMLALCQKLAGSSASHYFFGGQPDVTLKLIAVLQKRYPGLNIVGHSEPMVGEWHSPPDAETLRELTAPINAANPSVIWVGLGSPKQDLWMHHCRQPLNAPLIIGVGAAFDFISGAKRQAPLWMRRNGLEWLFRLVQEPRRLWRRYLLYNPRFIALVAWHLWRRKRD